MVKVLTLKKRKDFVRVAAGQKMVAHSLVLQAAQSLSAPYRTLDDESCFAGFTVTKKVGHAHLRNRTKRRLRAAMREVLPKLGRARTDYVFIGRYSTAEIDFRDLVNDMKMAVKRINKLVWPKEKAPESPVSEEVKCQTKVPADEASLNSAD